MPKYIATVHVLMDVENEANACDLMSALLTENGIYGADDSAVVDWSYREIDGAYGPRRYDVPDTWKPDDDLNQFLATHEPLSDLPEDAEFFGRLSTIR